MPARRIVFPLATAIASAFVLVVAAAQLPAGEPLPAGENAGVGVTVNIAGDAAVIANRFLSIEMATAAPAGKKLRTRSITNLITGDSTALEGDDFVLVFADKRTVKEANLVIEDAAEEPAAGGAKRLAFRLAGEALKVRFVVEMRPDQPWAARWLEIDGKGRLEKVSMAEWRAQGTYGPPGPGRTTEGLGYPQGYGQAAYVDDLFFAIEHPGAENFARGKRVACRVSAYDELAPGKPVATRRFVVGAGEAGGAPQAFLRFAGDRRAAPPRLVVEVAGRPGADPAAELAALAQLKAAGVHLVAVSPECRFYSGAVGPLEKLLAASKAAGIGVSVRFASSGPSGAGGETACLAGAADRERAARAFASWASAGIDGVDLDGFRPDCGAADHGHPVGPEAAVAQMDSLIAAMAAGRKARPDLHVLHLAGSNPSPFWLEHCDGVSPGGSADVIGEGDALERRATTIDGRLFVHRPTDMPMSAFAVEDLAAADLAGSSDAAFERAAWWLAARTSLHHQWSVTAGDLPRARWEVLARALKWAQARERLFRLSRMVGGDPRQGGIYGFAAFEGGAGVLALRNPSAKPATLERGLDKLLTLTRAAAKKSYRLTSVFGDTKALEGARPGRATLKVELPPFSVAVLEAKEAE